jgi:hypothetical protein
MYLEAKNPNKTPTLTVLSMGAGVQSSVMALMAAEGLIAPMPDVAIFANTQSDAPEVYKHLDWLEKQLPFPLVRVTAGSVIEDLLAGVNSTGQPFTSVPLYIKLRNGDVEKSSMGRREYKITPVLKGIRQQLGLEKGQRVPSGAFVHQWIGISTDEIRRTKRPAEPWIANRYPLLEHDMDRAACLKWFNDRFPERRLVKSSCIICPYRSPKEWKQMKVEQPAVFAEACRIDDGVRHLYPSIANARLEAARARIAALEAKNARGELTVQGKPYKVPALPSVEDGDVEQFVLKARIPLRFIDMVETSDSEGPDPDGFDNECEGMCGV